MSCLSFAQATGGVLELNDVQSSFALTGKFAYFEDPSRDLSFEDVRAPGAVNKFERVEDPNLNLGFTRSAVWLRFQVSKGMSSSDDWLLELPYPLLDRVEVYAVKGDEVETAVLGDSLPFHARPFDYRTFLLPLELSSEPTTYFLRVTTESSMQLRPRVISGGTFFIARSKSELLWGLLYGVILLMVVYNLFLFTTTRDLSYLLYSLAAGSAFIFILCLNGYAHQFLFPTSPALANFMSPFSSSLWLLFTALFAKAFLETKRYAPGLTQVLSTLVIIGLVATLLSLVAPYFIAMQFTTYAAILHGSVIAVVAAVCLRRGHPYARVFMSAWVFYGVGTSMLALSRLGFMPDSFLTYHSGTFGITTETILLSFALSEKYRHLQDALAAYSKGLELKVAERTQQLAEMSAKRKQLLADIVHDLGTPLSVISGYVQALGRGKLAPTEERFGVLNEELSLISNLVQDLRLLSLSDAGELMLERTETSAGALLNSVQKSFANNARERGVGLSLCLAGDLPRINLDAERMKRVLGNLVSNALRHTAEGGAVCLGAKLCEGGVVFSVTDTGEGVASDKLPQLFERFYRVEKSRSASGGGTGLGLAIARSIVELHGGDIWAESEKGAGMAVQIRLPLDRQTAVEHKARVQV